MRLPEEPDNPPQINIVSMIDVIFAILTFFVMSTLFLTQSEGLRVELPNAETGQLQSQTPVVVSLTADGAIAVGNEAASIASVVTRVQEAMQSDSSTLVVLKADQTTPHGEVVALMDLLRTIPSVQLAIATEQPPEN